MTGDSDRFPGYTVKDRRWWARPEEEVTSEGGAAQGEQASAAALEARLADAEQLLREAQARERQAHLEVDQARQRLERDARKEIDRARRDLVISLLPVLDDLDRALAAAREAGTAAALVTGVEHVRTGFLDRLRAFGVERFDPTGERFDPTLHEAVSMVAAREPHQSGLIVKTLRPGYVASDETIRPAQVIVAGPRSVQPPHW